MDVPKHWKHQLSGSIPEARYRNTQLTLVFLVACGLQSLPAPGRAPEKLSATNLCSHCHTAVTK